MNKSLKWPVAQWLELRWWKSYLKNKPVEEYIARKKEYWVKVLDMVTDHISIPSKACILDAGCGPAGINMILNAYQVDAVDPLLNQYDREIPHFDKSQFPNVRFYNSTIEEFKPDKLYDVIFCMNVINHVRDLDASYDLLNSWLKPGGILVISVDAHNYSFFKYLFRLIPGDALHPHQHDIRDYNAFLSTRAYSLEEPILLKKEFLFNHYIQIGLKSKG